MNNDETRRPRLDIAATIHKAVRKVLFDQAMLLARVDYRSADAARDAHAATLAALRALREHADHEDEIVFPVLAATDAPLAAEAMRQHEELESQMRDIERLSSLSVAGTSSERPGVGRRLQTVFNDFVAAQLTHLSFEEGVLMPVLWKHHTDEELFAMQSRIRALTPPDRGLEWRAILLASVDANERAMLGA
jgi:iron-sulfur cluster repair protein YtfE (RIC family)